MTVLPSLSRHASTNRTTNRTWLIHCFRVQLPEYKQQDEPRRMYADVQVYHIERMMRRLQSWDQAVKCQSDKLHDLRQTQARKHEVDTTLTKLRNALNTKTRCEVRLRQMLESATF